MADGYALIEINKEGKGRMKSSDQCPEVKFIDFRLEGCDFEYYGLDEAMMYSLPKDLKDVLVLCSFNIVGTESFNGESTDYDTEIHLESHMILKENYKDFCRKMITEELELKGTSPDCDDEQYYKNLLAEWEEFYSEDFEPFEKPKKIKFSFD